MGAYALDDQDTRIATASVNAYRDIVAGLEETGGDRTATSDEITLWEEVAEDLRNEALSGIELWEEKEEGWLRFDGTRCRRLWG
jgi:hypothetical protein